MDYNSVFNRLDTLLNDYSTTPFALTDQLREIKGRINQTVQELEMMVRVDMDDPDQKTKMLESIKGRVRATFEGRDVVRDRFTGFFPPPPPPANPSH